MFVCASCGLRYERGGYCAHDGQALAQTTDPLLGTEIGRYRLARLIGEGGMGQVYLGVQPTIGSRVAIKILSDQCARNPELLERFFAEAKAVNLIRHENIVSVLDLAQLPDGRPYIVMEFIEGQTLGAIIRAGSPSLGGIVLVMTELLSALGAAHAIGIVHRDLKPDNVLVTVEGHAKVLDFGIAKLAPGMGSALSPRTQTGALLGTPSYMAPEQITGAGNVDSRTDLYAAGIVLFEAVTGQVPFQGETLYDLMKAHLEAPPPPPRSLRPDLPPGFEHVILQALAKEPRDRFQTAEAMVQALQHAATVLSGDQWRPLSSRAARIAARPSMERALQPTPSGAAGRIATPIPTPNRSPTPEAQLTRPEPPDRTEAVRGRGRWVALAALALVAGGGTLVAVKMSGSAAPPAEASPESSAPAAGSSAPTASPPSAPPAGEATPPPQAPPSTSPPPAAPARERTAEPARAPSSPSTASGVTGTPTIIGGGSAIDHGVEISGDVHIGPGVVIGGGPASPSATPSRFTRPADYDATKFDASAYAPKALALARTLLADAGFVRFDVHYVFPSGKADLTKSDSDTSYLFRSPSHSARPAGLPSNVDAEIACYVEVTIGVHEVEVRVRDNSSDAACRWPIRGLPRCSLAQVWAKAQADGVPGDAIAKVGFLEDGTFMFDGAPDGSGGIKTYADACR